MLAIAADEVRARSRAAWRRPAANPRSRLTLLRSAPNATALQPIFEDVQLRVFDLGNVNEAELVLTAKARMPQTPHQKQPASPDLQYMITIVARQDVNGDLHKALANITDTQHLDAIPSLELIDAVDVDGDGRGELLFRAGLRGRHRLRDLSRNRRPLVPPVSRYARIAKSRPPAPGNPN